MANRDVNLVIRAKNQASKSLDSVSDALKVLRDAQDGVSSSASKTDGAIGALGSELDKLKAKSTAFAGFEKASKIMGTAAEFMQRLQTAVAETKTKLSSFATASQELTTRLNELRSAESNLAAEAKKQREDLAAAESLMGRKAVAVKKLAAAQKALADAEKMPAGDKRTAKIETAQARLAEASAVIAEYKRLQGTLTETRSRMAEVGGEIRKLNKAESDLKRQIVDTNNAIGPQEQALKDATSEYAQIESRVNEAGAALRALSIDTDSATKNTSELIPQIERLGAAMQAMIRFSNGMGAFVNPAEAAKMQKLRTEADAAKKSFMDLAAQRRALNAAMQASGGGTEADRAQWQALRAAMNAAKGTYRDYMQQLRTGVSVENASADATRKSAAAAKEKQQAMLKLNRESRMSMSIFQRLRGQVLSLTTAYVGLFGGIQQIGGALSAFQQMEAATNRLGVVFGQNQEKISSELTWLQSQASRLGIEFGVLSDQYTKFAVAADAANFSLGDTRKIFLSVAEAGRVNKLSLEDMKGMFLALQQMISKGKISSEELRQQLGERLPGAMNIMADALGVGTDELYKMLEAGEVLADSSNLLKFADELDRRFGPQLSKSLKSTTTLIGKFFNNIFQAQLQFANGGFIEGFNRALERMNKWFESREGRDFFLSLGATAERVIDVFVWLSDSASLIKSAIQTLIALKFAQWIAGGVQGMMQSIAASRLMAAALLGNAEAMAVMNTNQLSAIASTQAFTARIVGALGALKAFFTTQATSVPIMTRFAAAMTSISVGLSGISLATVRARAGMAAMAVGMGVLRGATVALNAALAAMGGWVGLLITVGTLIATPYLVDWMSGVDNATAALDEHQRIMSAVVEQYQDVGDSAKDWAKNLDGVGVSVDQVEAAILKMRDANEELLASLDFVGPSIGDMIVAGFQSGSQVSVSNSISQLNIALKRGQISAADYEESLSKLYNSLESNNTASRETVAAALEVARKYKEQLKAANELEVVAENLGSTLEGVAGASDRSGRTIEELGGKVEETGDQFGVSTTKSEEFRAKLKEIADLMPEIASGLDSIKDKAKLDEAFAGAAQAAQTMTELAGAVDLYSRSLQGLYTQQAGKDLGGFTSGLDASKAIVRDREGFQETGKWDVNAFRAGYGSDTVTLADGSIVKITEGMRVSVEDAERDLGRRIGEFQTGIVKSIGVDRWAQFNAAQQASLTSIAYNYGSLPERIIGAVRSGTSEDIAKAISGLQGDNEGINRDRRLYEAGAFLQTDSVDSQVKAYEESVKRRADEEARITEEKRKQREQTDQALADLGFENQMLDLKAAGKEKEAFIEDAIRDLKQQNTDLTAAQEAKARELLARQYELNAATKAEKATKTEIEVIEQRINDLQSQRSALIEQRDIYGDQGNTEKVASVEAQIKAVNTQLSEAITQANAMHAAIGGEGAAASIAQNDALKLSIEGVNTSLEKTAYTQQQVQQNIFSMLDNGVIGMFDALAQAIANGESGIKALGTAFRQFAADFLMEIAKMILKQAMLNALQAVAGGITGGLSSIMFHSGGEVGSSSGSGRKSASPAWFNNAVRYHSGGIAGLKPNEVPTILEKGEEVLTANDPRHARNGKSSGKASTKVVNMFDAASFLSEAMSSTAGEEVILNFVRANPAAFKQALEG